jgi:metallo-beta-lactamase family protein
MDSNIKLTFLGGANTVTGSNYLLETNNKKYLIDMGLFQGADVFEHNYEDLEFNPKSIDAVFLTHAHIDHSGLLPKLVKHGFTGDIYTTIPTYHICNHLLIDSANVQDKNEKYNNIPAIYRMEDALETLNLMKPIQFDQEVKLDDIAIRFRKASHILGAASIELQINQKKICFSGDIGRQKPTIIDGFGAISKEQDYVIMESLYGDREHTKREMALNKLVDLINNTLRRNGNVIIPVFALHRSQETLFFIKRFIDEGLIDKNVQIFFDSPLATKVLNLYTEYTNYYSPEFKSIRDPFGLQNPNLQIIKSGKQSTRLAKKKGVIIIAGGGMLEGGRALSHLYFNINDSRSSLAIMGFQAEGTLGRKLLERPKSIVDNRGKKFDVKINIEEISGLSGHGDKTDLLFWVERFEKRSLKKIFLVHAEPYQSEAFKDELVTRGYQVVVPNRHQSFEL